MLKCLKTIFLDLQKTKVYDLARKGTVTMPKKSFTELALDIGKLVEDKNKSYGSAFNKAGDFLRVLYPEGIKPSQYKDMLCVVRIFDKLMRIATSYEGTKEKEVDAYSDIMGYALLGLSSSEKEKHVPVMIDPFCVDKVETTTLVNKAFKYEKSGNVSVTNLDY